MAKANAKLSKRRPRVARTPRKPAAVKVIDEGALPAPALRAAFPQLDLPIHPPYPPMEAKPVKEIPSGAGWQYEPKWDGFRCLAFRDGKTLAMQSKAGQPLTRYFPEVAQALLALPHKRFVLDGEIIIEHEGVLHFDELLQRIHPAESRIRRLATETPAKFMAFDLLVDERSRLLTPLPLGERHARLENFFETIDRTSDVKLCPFAFELSQARRWMQQLAGTGCDGVIAKKLDSSYRSGEREGMVKIKSLRTAECVVGGFRYASKGGGVGSLLLGLYDDEGLLDHCGFCSSFNAGQRVELLKILKPLVGGEGFTGAAPGGPSRWSTDRSTEWTRLRPELVCEVQYDHFSGGRFRHGTKFLRWRPEKSARQCTFDQVRTPATTPLARSA